MARWRGEGGTVYCTSSYSSTCLSYFHTVVLSGVSGDREKIVSPVELTTSRIGNHIPVDAQCAICDNSVYKRTYSGNSSESPATLVFPRFDDSKILR